MSSTSPGQVPSIAKCAIASLVLILILFSDVIFAGASLAPLDYDSALHANRLSASPSVYLYPESKDRKIVDSWGDIGAAAWQYQPTLKFMAYCMRTGESPWWNPYDASGRMEPEGMWDIPFSAITVVTAAFGGGSTAFSFLLLGLYFTSVFALLLTLTRYLNVSFLAGCAGCAAYLLSGFTLGNLSSQMGQPYFFAPLSLLALFAFARRPIVLRFVLAALAQALLFLVTFVPTMVLAEISISCVFLASVAPLVRDWKTAARVFLMQCAVSLAALGLVAFLYLPILEATLNYVGLLSAYNARPSPGYSLESALSLFTSKHFWQSYLAFRPQPGWPEIHTERWVFHIGILVSLIAASGLAWFKNLRLSAVSLTCGLLVAIAVGQMFGIPPFTLIDRLPFFRFVRNEYWPALSGIPIAILVAFGIDNRGKWGIIPLASVSAAIAASFIYLWHLLGIPAQEPERTQVLVLIPIFVLGAIAVLLLRRGVPFTRQLRWALAAGVLLEGIHYMNNLHATREHREENLPEAIEWIKRQTPSAAGNRVLNIGGSGIMPDWGGAIQVPQVGSFAMALVESYRRFFNQQMGVGLFRSFYNNNSTFRFTRESLSLAGVRFVIVGRDCPDAIARLRSIGMEPVHYDAVRLIFANPAPMPRAFLASQLASRESEPWESPPLPAGSATTTDPLLIDAGRRLGIVGQLPPAASAGSAFIEEYHHTKIRIRTASALPAVLVVTDSWHPNWKAHVDGAEAHLGRVDITFRGIVLPAGNHNVELTYRPKTLTLGYVISIATLVLLLLSILSQPRRYLMTNTTLAPT